MWVYIYFVVLFTLLTLVLFLCPPKHKEKENKKNADK